MSLKFPTIPSKTLRSSITAAATSFQLNDIKGWDGETDLTSGDFGTEHYVIFRNATKTVVELMEIDPSTIASASITIVRRGLQFDGDLLTEVSANKQSWVKGDTFVDLGTATPQTLQWLKEYIDGVAIAGAPDSSTSTKGIVKISTAPADPAEPIAVGTNDPRVPTQDENNAMVGGGDFGTPGSGNKFITEEYVGDGIRTTYDFAGSPHTFTPKDGVKKVLVQMWGAGASGGYISRTDTSATGTGGGGGGAYIERWFAKSEIIGSVTIAIGQGGAAVSGSGNTSAAGNVGGNTTFGSLLTAFGGGANSGQDGGGGASSFAAGSGADNAGPGGTSALADSGTPTTAGHWGGGGGGGGGYTSGTVAHNGGKSIWGGGGGAGVRTASARSGGLSAYGGNGGASARSTTGNVTATSGTTPGGGGGAATTGNGHTATSGAGGNGRCIVTEFYA